MAKSKNGGSPAEVKPQDAGLLGAILAIMRLPFKIMYAALAPFVYYFFIKPVLYVSTTKYRWAVVIPIVLPMSKIHTWLMILRSKLIFYLYGSTPAQAEGRHKEKVAVVAAGIRANAQSANPKKMCTSRPTWDNMSIFHAQYKSSFYQVDLNKFIDIVSIDEKKQTVRVEPFVNVGQITANLLPRGWTLCVLPELDDLTVGGLIAGFGIESSSHQYGLFQHIVASMDVVLADGSLVHCSADENAELFYNLPWSYGTLGFLVCCELRLRRASNFVRLTYTPFHNRAAFEKAFEEVSEDRGKTHDLVEALAYSRDEFVLMTGNYVDAPKKDGEVHDIGTFYGPWFYKHVEQFLSKTAPKKAGKKEFVEYIPLRAYYHRHTRSLFWELADIIPFGHEAWFRYLFGWLGTPKVGFFKLTTNAELHEIYVNNHVDQDMLIHIKTLGRFLDHLDETVKMYPLWLCPCRIETTPVRGLVNHDYKDKSDMYVDVGIYGIPAAAKPENGGKFEGEKALRNMESLVRELKGFQALYAITYQTRPEFYEMFDHTKYFELRERYGATELLPEVFDKISVTARGEKSALNHAQYPPRAAAKKAGKQ